MRMPRKDTSDAPIVPASPKSLAPLEFCRTFHPWRNGDPENPVLDGLFRHEAPQKAGKCGRFLGRVSSRPAVVAIERP